MEFFSLLPTWYLTLTVGGLGLIIGSFLNVLTYRFNTGRSLNGASHCLSCAKRLRWYELLPVVSYLVLRGRCQHCKSRIPPHYALVELVTALLFILVAFAASSLTELVLHWLLVAVLVVVAVYDQRHLIIPDTLVIILFALAFSIVGSHSDTIGLALTSVVNSALGAVVAAGVYWSLWRYSRGTWMGLGDAKLALPLGFLVGITNVFSFVVLSFWVGAGVSLAIIAYQRVVQGTTTAG